MIFSMGPCFKKINEMMLKEGRFKVGRVATLPGNMEFDNLGKNPWNFEQKPLKKPGILIIFTCSLVKLRFDSKNLSYKLKKFVIINFFLLKNIFKVAL